MEWGMGMGCPPHWMEEKPGEQTCPSPEIFSMFGS